jgi:hypothetical protein
MISDSRLVHIPAGARHVWTFRIRVDPGLPPGTKIVNHAHVTAIDKRFTTNTVKVTVRE